MKMITQEQLEELFNAKLIVYYDSREDNNADEEFGHFTCYEPEDQSIDEESGCPPIVCVYENDLVQFFHDATPYPTSHNSKDEARTMMMTLCPSPTPISNLTKEDYDNFIGRIKEEYL